MPRSRKKSFYSVVRGRIPGVYKSWSDCRTQVHGYHGNVYKESTTIEEADAYFKMGEVRYDQTLSVELLSFALFYITLSARLKMEILATVSCP
jgi:viroplasmin and RNaseH domain-containing protein